MIDTVIVSGGMIQKDFALDFIRKIEEERKGKKLLLLAADRGLDFFLETGLVPDIVDGDFDSLSGAGKAYLESLDHTEIVRLNPEKDDTDTEYAIREAIRRGAMEIVVIGATGTRIDHVLGNISLLGIGLEEQIKISLVDEHNRIRMINQPLTIRKEEQYGKYVSLIPFSEKVCGVTLRGLKYPLTDYTMGGFNSLGISNEIVSDEATISFSSGELIVIESKD